MQPNLTFCGAAGTVTGSCSLVTTDSTRFLVDCGLYQGNRSVRELNRAPHPFDVKETDFLVLTHAHIDHSGLIPKLVKEGFAGPIYATRATADMLEFMWPDSAAIQKSSSERFNRKQRRRGQKEVEPLYTADDVERALELLQPIEYEARFQATTDIELCLWNAGHILGSASVEVKLSDTPSGNNLRMLFSGDLGPDEKVFHLEPESPEGLDYIICESTYGDRDRDDYTLEKRRQILGDELKAGLERGGNVVIPAFAVERSQELLHDIHTLMERREIPQTTFFLDSPLASKATKVFMRHANELEDIEVSGSDLFRHERFRLVHSVEESKAIKNVKGGAIILSASGMCDAGRIKHHLRNNIWRPESTILFVGYQAPGTLGHVITSGAREVRIHGKSFKVRAQVRRIGNYSAHADQGELADWITERSPVVGGVFLNHGEDDARTALRELLVDRGLERSKIFIPAFDETFDLVAGTVQSKGRAAARIDDAMLQRDWYNDYAAFILHLANELETTEDGAKRQQLISRLRSVLQG